MRSAGSLFSTGTLTAIEAAVGDSGQFSKEAGT